MKKKLVSTLLIATMVISSTALTACGSNDKKKKKDKVDAPTVKELFKSNTSMVEDLKDGKQSIKATVSGAMEAKVDGEKVKASGKAMAETDGKTVHVSAEYDVALDGDKQDGEVEAYVTTDGEIYANIPQLGMGWIKTETEPFDLDDIEIDEDDKDLKDAMKDIQDAIEDDKNASLELKGDEWVLTYKFDAKDANTDALEDVEEEVSGLGSMLGGLDFDADDLENLEGYVTTTIKFDKDTQYLTYLGVEFSDEFLESVADLAGDEIDSISKLEFELKIEYNKDSIEIPSKVKDEALDTTGAGSGIGGIDIGGGTDLGGNTSGDNTYSFTVGSSTINVMVDDEWTSKGDGMFTYSENGEFATISYIDSYVDSTFSADDLEDWFDEIMDGEYQLLSGTIDAYPVYAGVEEDLAYILVDTGASHLVAIVASAYGITIDEDFIETVVSYIM